MSFSDDLNACAAIVQKGDPWRFRTVMAAPVDARAKLFPLYAFNVEVSRAPWVTAEPMIAEMRLQWWRDALEEIGADGKVRRHEVVSPLADVLSTQDVERLDQLIAARRWDCYKDPFEDDAALDQYLQHTAGHLMVCAAGLLGPTQGPIRGADQAGYGAGVAAFLRAIPGLVAQKRIPLVDGTPDGVRALAARGLASLNQARNLAPKSSAPAFWPVMGAEKCLKFVLKHPASVADGPLPQPGGVLFAVKAALGRW
ncbi:MAG: squalene/phytoene synthase family protein [Paracoccaceae bacterium]